MPQRCAKPPNAKLLQGPAPLSTAVCHSLLLLLPHVKSGLGSCVPTSTVSDFRFGGSNSEAQDANGIDANGLGLGLHTQGAEAGR
jgi:hypothetical protein